MIINNAIRDTKPDGLLIFGLFQPVRRYSEKLIDSITRRGLFRYCSACDQFGNMYDIYTDYDPCLSVSETIAIIKEEVKP